MIIHNSHNPRHSPARGNYTRAAELALLTIQVPLAHATEVRELRS
jgi:hypothetical protein